MFFLYILITLLFAYLLYAAAWAVAWPLQHLLYYGVAALKSLSILPEDMEYTMDLALTHAEIVMSAFVIALIGYGILKVISVFYNYYVPGSYKAFKEKRQKAKEEKQKAKENSED